MRTRLQNTRHPSPVWWLIGGAALAVCAALAGCGETSAPAPDPADRLFRGANILTMDGSTPSAVAVRGETIVWTGAAENSDRFIGADTEIVDLGERALLPGFIDAHGHFTFLASLVRSANLAPPPVGAVSSIAELQQTLREHIAERGIPPGEWVFGFGYDDSLMAERRHPTRDDLDVISTEHPIGLTHVSGHLSAVNSAGLERIGIAAETPDPSGGIIRRRPGSREPDGVLEETAAYPLRAENQPDPAELPSDIEAALLTYAGYGMTTAQDGAFSLGLLPLLQEMADEGRLKLDVSVYPAVRSASDELPDLDWRAMRGPLTVAGVKLFLDGSPQGKTAYLTKPYEVPPHGQPADYRGYPTYEQPQVDAMVARFLGEGVQVLAHANGDAAADMLIDAVEAANPTHDHRTVMIHAQTVREDQLDRMAKLAMIPSFFAAHTFFWGDWHRDSVLGVERGSRISPTRSTVNRNMRFTIHNDAPVVPPNAIRLLWAATNRQTRSGQTLGPEQQLTVMEALRAMTVDAAFQNFEENRKGVIAAGMQADLVVLSQNPVTLGAERLLELEVAQTISRGRTVFTAE